MPMYEYECGACGRRFEVIQKFSDPLLSECQLCHASGVKKVLSSAAFVLKGGGWYATDYPSADRKKAADAEKPAPASTETKAPACAGGTCSSGTCPAKS